MAIQATVPSNSQQMLDHRNHMPLKNDNHSQIDNAIRTLEEVIHTLQGLKTHSAHWFRLQDSMSKAEHQVRLILLPTIKAWNQVQSETPLCVRFDKFGDSERMEFVRAFNIKTSEILRQRN